QTAQGVFARLSKRVGPAIDAALAVLAENPALARQHESAAVRGQHPAQQFFVVAEAVKRRRVEQRHPAVERPEQQGLGGGRIGRRAVAVAEVHAAQANGNTRAASQPACRRDRRHDPIIPVAARPGKAGRPTSSYAGLRWKPTLSFRYCLPGSLTASIVSNSTFCKRPSTRSTLRM